MNNYFYYWDDNYIYSYNLPNIGNLECPLNATIIVPPVEDKKIAKWNPDTNEWYLIEDHRPKIEGGLPKEGTGTKYWLPEDNYLSEGRYMTEPGPLPENALLKRPEVPYEIALDSKLNKINNYISSTINEGFDYTFNDITYHIYFNEYEQLNLQEKMLDILIANIYDTEDIDVEVNVYLNNEKVTLTMTSFEFIKLFRSAISFKKNLLLYGKELKDKEQI